MIKHLIFAATAIFFVSTTSLAQEEEYEEETAFKPSFAVKWNPAGLYFGKVTLGGEVNLNPRRSITAVIGLPKDKSLNYDFNDKEESLTYKTTSIMGGYRMYLGKKSMTGFYFEPYLKYLNNQGLLPDIKTTINNEQATFRLSSEYTSIGIGAQLGVQFAIADRVVIDWFLIGPEGNRSKFQLTFQDVSNPPTSMWGNVEEDDARRELEEIIDDIPILGNKIDIDIDRPNKTVKSSYRGFVPGFRTGISIGVKF
jgi:hypothetical protein